jgi:hypothetical protein
LARQGSAQTLQGRSRTWSDIRKAVRQQNHPIDPLASRLDIQELLPSSFDSRVQCGAPTRFNPLDLRLQRFAIQHMLARKKNIDPVIELNQR